MNKRKRIKLMTQNELYCETHGITIQVQKKDKFTELGTTEYTFSYSFKGDMLNNPINPYKLADLASDMSKLIDNKGQILIALDRGGTALGLAISVIAKMPLHIAFSYFTNPPKRWISWEERGAGKRLAIPPLSKNSHVILIDDEINTGSTYIDAINELKKNYIYVDQILVVAEVIRKKPGRLKILEIFNGVKISSLYFIPEPKFDNKSNSYVFELFNDY